MEFIWDVMPGNTSEGRGMGSREGEEANGGVMITPVPAAGAHSLRGLQKDHPRRPTRGVRNCQSLAEI